MAAAADALSHPALADCSVLATDLDGTLLRPDLTVSDATRQAIRRAVDRGIHVVFVTGRPPRWLPPVAAETGHAGTAICANGAVVIDMAAERIVSAQAIPKPDIAALLTEVRAELGPHVQFGAEQARPGPISRARLLDESDDIASQPGIVKVLARGKGSVSRTEHLAAAVTARMGTRVTVTHSSRTHQLLEVAPSTVTKATALSALVHGWGLRAADVVAVGDMPNDVPLVRWAGLGLAVASAHPGLLAVCQAVIPDAEHDGVAQVLRAMRPSR